MERALVRLGANSRLFLLTLAGLAPFCLLHAQEAASAEEVKAAMVFNFTKFIEWPPESMSDGGKFVIAVLGPAKVASSFEQALRDRTVLGRPVVIRRAQNPEEVKHCQILVISSREAGVVQETIQALRGTGVLTVGEGTAFTRSGGVIGFVLLDNRLNFEINLDAARQARLSISSKLLRLATVKGG